MFWIDDSLVFTSMAGLQVLTLPVTEISKPFLLNSSWFLIPQDTLQACYPKIYKTLEKLILGYWNHREPGLENL